MMGAATITAATRQSFGIPIEAALQNIASAAHARGVVVTSGGAPLREMPAAELLRTLRAAWTATRGDAGRLKQVETIIRTVAIRVGQPGPVAISRMACNVAKGYAKGTK